MSDEKGKQPFTDPVLSTVDIYYIIDRLERLHAMTRASVHFVLPWGIKNGSNVVFVFISAV